MKFTLFFSWQLVAGLTTTWQAIPQMFPVHGAATAFFQSKFWVLGGSTGDDQYDHTITDKGMFVQKQKLTVLFLYLIKMRRSTSIESPF